jgi:hypothetical protein
VEELEEALANEPIEALRAVAMYLNGWYKDARSEFMDETKVFRIRMADDDEYAKHFPRGGMSKEQIRNLSTKTGDSKFYKGVRGAELDMLLPGIFEERFDLLMQTPAQRFAVDCLCVVGATAGHDTQIVAVETNLTIAHAYPISAEEVRLKGLLLSSDDSLQGFFSE